MKRFKHILCVVDTSAACKVTLERAITLAENNQASLTVVNVIERVSAGIGLPEGGPISADLQEALKNEHAQELESLVNPYRKRIEIQTKLLTGTPFLEIICEVIRNDHDLLIKMPEVEDWLDRLFGSDDMHLLRKCPCPVWLIKPQAPKSFRRIMAAVDVDDSEPPTEQKSQQLLNMQILEIASALALSDFAELHIAHAWEAAGEGPMRSAFVRTPEKTINDYIKKVRQHHVANLDTLIAEVSADLGQDNALEYLKPQTHLLKGGPRKEIPKLAKQIEADLVVMGTVARTGIPGFIMGNTAETILNQLDCSVLAIKPAGFVTPVTLEE